MRREAGMMRVGMLGTGIFAESHAKSLTNIGATIAGCYGTNPSKTEAFSTRHDCSIFENSLELISPDLIDVLYIVVPPFAHDGRWEEAAIERHIPFLCEKPVCLDLSLGRALAEKVAKSGLVTTSGFVFRQGETAARVREVIARNEVSIARSCRMGGLTPKKWARRMAGSGGMMVEAGIHSVDFMRWVFGEIRWVWASATSGISTSIEDCDLYDSMDARIGFENGAIANLSVCNILNHGASKLDLLDVFGKDFMLTFDGPWEGDKVRYKEGPQDWAELTIDAARLDLHNRGFLEAVSAADPSRVRGDYPDAVRSLEAVLAMNRSAETDQKVYLSK
jgi:predicted dehydrogenase